MRRWWVDVNRYLGLGLMLRRMIVIVILKGRSGVLVLVGLRRALVLILVARLILVVKGLRVITVSVPPISISIPVTRAETLTLGVVEAVLC